MYCKSRWDTPASGPMSESAIRLIHGAPERARVSRYTYEVGDEIQGTSKHCTCYLLQGAFTFVSKEGTASFEADDVFVFSGGDYSLRVDGTTRAIAIWAWELPMPAR